MPNLEVRPITLRAANAYVALHHRHHRPARGCVFCISVWQDGELCGVAIVGRPLARMLQDGATCEVLRCCTNGTYNACSKLYATAAKAARVLGYQRIVTYTLPAEGGASLRAAGWVCEAPLAGGGTWSREGRLRGGELNTTRKLRWAA
jgi:hypothetical protein